MTEQIAGPRQPGPAKPVDEPTARLMARHSDDLLERARAGAIGPSVGAPGETPPPTDYRQFMEPQTVQARVPRR
ncbi:MAG: hypothetical protein HOQ05_02695 [Corynebacteriales bacterium]|nr:hypothetical protein [Mycobacteriales bacterium]